MSQLLGILSGLVSLLADGILFILQPFIDFLVKNIVVPLITMLINLILYIIGIYLYLLGSFLLMLIDFVEALFRALAGLGGGNIELSLGGKEGDILLQLIQNNEVQSAFLAMCIVGLFLLVITTVFQIIKVEYTTEGAKNAKGPIFNKAFKGMANLLLLPLLVVFGIVLANQVLSLLDNATRADTSKGTPTISGTLFITSASNAFYLAGADHVKVRSATPINAIPEVLSNIFPIFKNSIKNAWDSDAVESHTELELDEGIRKGIEEDFMTQELSYFDLSEVTEYYDYSQINYFLLIFGSFVVLKSFFFTCFGMIIRLYKCAILFIIAPAVIGMTPINEGGLSRWRTSFIGQVLSAYGTVLSVNLFLIIVRVLLNIDIKFTGNLSQLFGSNGTNLMTSLLKSILVIAGCLLIEQFAKELGGFFGADDAMGAGKGMAKQVGDVAMKGVGIAAGAGMLAASGGAMAVGLAKGMGHGIAGAVSGVKNGKGFKGKAGGLIKGLGKGVDEMTDNIPGLKAVKDVAIKNRVTQFRGWRAARGVKKVNKQFEPEIDKKKNQIEKERKTAEKAENVIARRKAAILKKGGKAEDFENDDVIKRATGLRDRANIRADASKADVANLEEKRKQAADKEIAKHGGQKVLDKALKDGQWRSEHVGYAISSMAGYSNQAKLKYNPFAKALAANDKVAAEGAKTLGDSFEASVDRGVVYQRNKKHRDDMSDRVFKGWNDDRMDRAAQLVMGHVGEETDYYVANQVQQTNRELENILQELQAWKRAHGNSTQGMWQDSNILSRLGGFVQRANDRGANLQFGDLQAKLEQGLLNGHIEEFTKADLNLNFDADTISKAISKAMKSDGVVDREVLSQELKKAFADAGKEGNTGMLQAIEHIIEKVFSDINH